MFEFAHVERGAGLGHGCEVEHGNELVEGSFLNAVWWAPPQQRQVVRHGLGREPTVDVVPDRHVVTPFGQLLAFVVDDEGKVGEHGVVVDAEGVTQQQDLGGDVDEVLTADDVGDSHVGVVDGVGNEEQGCAGGALYDEVLEVGVGEGDRPTHHVVPAGGAIVGDGEPNDPSRPRSETEFTAVSVIPGGTTASLSASFDLIGGARTPVGVAAGEQPFDRFGVQLAALRLEHGFAVPVEPEPFEHPENDVDELRPGPFGVGVLDAQHELAAHVAGVHPVEQGRAGPTEVEVPGGGRGETGAHDRGHPPMLPTGRRTPKTAGPPCGGRRVAS